MNKLNKTMALFRCLPSAYEYFFISNIEELSKVVSIDIEIGTGSEVKHRLHLNAIFDPKTRMISIYTRISFTLPDESVTDVLKELSNVQHLLFNEDHMCNVISDGFPDDDNYTHFFVYTNQYLPARFVNGDPSEKSVLALKHILNQFVDSYSAIFNFLLKNVANKAHEEQKVRRLN